MGRTISLVLAVSVMLAACIAPVEPDASGDEIYVTLCARCHGSDLSGGIGPALGAGSSLVDEPDEYLVSTITDGRGRMPAFRSSLDEAQIERVAGFLREQQDP